MHDYNVVYMWKHKDSGACGDARYSWEFLKCCNMKEKRSVKEATSMSYSEKIHHIGLSLVELNAHRNLGSQLNLWNLFFHYPVLSFKQ